MPVGSQYRLQDGRAAVTLSKTDGGEIMASATCDSLQVLTTTLSREVEHYRSETDSLKQRFSAVKTAEIAKPSGWQWFQIWLGRILSGVALIALGWFIINHK
jgi:hypothetical protein